MRFFTTTILLSSLTFALGDSVTFYKKQNCVQQIGGAYTLNNQCVLSQADIYAQSVFVAYNNPKTSLKAYQSTNCDEKAYKIFKKLGPGCHSFGGYTVGSVRKA